MTAKEVERLTEVLRMLDKLYAQLRYKLTAEEDLLFRSVVLEVMTLLRISDFPKWWDEV